MNWEIAILQALQNIRNSFLTSIMEAITALAESLPLVIVLSILYWCSDKKKTVRIYYDRYGYRGRKSND